MPLLHTRKSKPEVILTCWTFCPDVLGVILLQKGTFPGFQVERGMGMLCKVSAVGWEKQEISVDLLLLAGLN